MKYIDDAIKELDEMDGYISAYKVQLNVSCRSSTLEVTGASDHFDAAVRQRRHIAYSVSRSRLASTNSEPEGVIERAGESHG